MTITRHGERRGRRCGGRRRGVGRRRHTWHPAVGPASWTYTWTPNELGTVTIKSRAVDDSGNIETPAAGVTVIGATARSPSGATRRSPASPPTADTSAIELGVKFRSDVAGFITGLRFYKGAANTGTHVGSLWTSDRHAAGHGHLHQRDGHGLAAGHLLHPGGDHRQHDLRRLLPHQRGHYAVGRPATSPRRGHERPAACAARRRRRRQRRLSLRLDEHVPDQTPSSRDNYWVDVVFDTNSDGQHAADGHEPDPGAGCHRGGHGATRDGHLQRAGAGRHDRRSR